MSRDKRIASSKISSVEIAIENGWRTEDQISLFGEVYEITTITEECVIGKRVGEQGHFVPAGYNGTLYVLDLRHTEWQKLS